jgi:quercetin dioxygenase-like cupin family protein
MEHWNLRELDVEPHSPRILTSPDEGRAIVLQLPADEELQEHEVHEQTWLTIVEGELDVTTEDGERVSVFPGDLLALSPQEARTVRAVSDSRLLLLLTPWPGDGHPGAMSLEDKGSVRERAAARNAQSG